MTKLEAAAFLGVSIRAIERYTAKGRLSVRYTKGKRGNVASYNESELQAIKTEMEQALAIHKPAIEQETPTVPTSTVKADNLATTVSGVSELSDLAATIAPIIEQDILSSLSELAQKVSGRVDRLLSAIEALGPDSKPTPISELAAKLTLSLKEAARLSGLSAGWLRTAIKHGDLQATKRGRGWNIKRADLEKYISNL